MKSRVVWLCLLVQGLAWGGNFQQAYEAALSNDATFQAARAELASALQNLPMARAGLRPNIALSVSDSKARGTRTIDSAVTQPDTRLDYRAPVQSLNLRAPLFNREASEKVTLAEAQAHYAEAIFEVKKADLVDRLADAYLRLLLSDQAVLTAQAQLDASTAQSLLARRRLQLGEGTRPDLVEAEAAVALGNALLSEARDQLSVARLAFQQIAGPEAELPMPFPNGFAPHASVDGLMKSTEPLTQLLGKADASNPSIAARRYAVDMAQAAIARNRAGHYPRLDLIASASSSRNESVSTLNQSVRQRVLGLQLNVPLYSGGYVDASVTQALADQDKANADLLTEQQAVARELTRLYLVVSNGLAKINAYRQTVAATELSFDAARRSLASGFSTQADVVLAQHRLARSQQDLAQATFDYLLARIRLFARSGTDPAEAVAHIDALLRPP